MLSAPGRPTTGDERPPRALPAAATSNKRPRAIAESRSPWGRARDPCACAPLPSRAVTRPEGGCSPSRTGPRTDSRSRWDPRPPLAVPPPTPARWSLALGREGRWDVSRGAPCSALRTARAGRLARLAREGDEPDAPRAPSALPPTRAVILPFSSATLNAAGGGGSLRGTSPPTGAGSGSDGTASLAPALAGGCACWLSATRSTGLSGGAGGGSAVRRGRNASGSK